ncbi:hypothetical protein ACLB2K_041152 [Fragaria x ananassa]
MLPLAMKVPWSRSEIHSSPECQSLCAEQTQQLARVPCARSEILHSLEALTRGANSSARMSPCMHSGLHSSHTLLEDPARLNQF